MQTDVDLKTAFNLSEHDAKEPLDHLREQLSELERKMVQTISDRLFSLLLLLAIKSLII
jgi:hypothetical protein